MDDDGALFDLPEAPHPDQEVARREIGRFYADQVAQAEIDLAKAQQAVANAEAALAARQHEQAAWQQHGTITPHMLGDHDQAGDDIVWALWGRVQAATRPLLAQLATDRGQVVNTSPDADRLCAAADTAQQRMDATRRWLTAKGYDLGALAQPRPPKPRR